MKDKREKEQLCFNKSGAVLQDAQAQGTFLDYEYGDGMFLQNPAEALAYALISAHKRKHYITTSLDEKCLSVAAIMSELDHMFDFHESFPKKDFLDALAKTFRGKYKSVEDFICRLDENIIIKDNSEHLNNLIKRRMMNQVENFIKIHEEAGLMEEEMDKKAVLLQLYGVSSPPQGYSKMDLMTIAQDCIFSDKREIQKVIDDIGVFSKDYENLMLLFPELKAHFKAYEDLSVNIKYLTISNNEELLKNKIVESTQEESLSL